MSYRFVTLASRSRVDDSTPRIPLREVVRFRESQWFLEELEVGAA